MHGSRSGGGGDDDNTAEEEDVEVEDSSKIDDKDKDDKDDKGVSALGLDRNLFFLPSEPCGEDSFAKPR